MDYDVIVLGGGSAGAAAGRAASLAGARTAVINDGELGGLCILRGCMPTKTMLQSAHIVHEATHAEPLGVRLEGRMVPEFGRIMARKDALVERFKRAKIASIESQDYDVLDGRAVFAAGGGVSLAGQTLKARGYVIATGSVPRVPPLPGLDTGPYLTSDDVMRLESPPASMVICGAGAVGLELAQFFARVGTEVLLVARTPLLSRYDRESGEELTRVLGDEPRIDLAIPGELIDVGPDGSGVRVRYESAGRVEECKVDALLIAKGRRAALDDLGLEHVGLSPDDGALSHDARMQTSNPEVFVSGDATGVHQILHLANQEGAIAGHNAAGGEPPRTIDYRLKMSVTFTDPPFAHVGMTEHEVEAERAAGREILEGRASFPKTGRAITMGARHGLWKLWVDRGSCEVLGSVILGPRADDLVHLVSQMMYYRGTVNDIAKLPWYHPTLSEVMITLGRDLAGKFDSCELPTEPPA